MQIGDYADLDYLPSLSQQIQLIYLFVANCIDGVDFFKTWGNSNLLIVLNMKLKLKKSKE